MNAKKAKAARKLARQLSAGMPERQLLGKSRKVKRSHKGKEVEYEQQQAVNNPKSTRGIYRQLKKLLRMGIPLPSLQPQTGAVPLGDEAA